MKRLFVSFLVLCCTCICAAADAPKGLLTAPLLAVDEIRAQNLKLEIAEDGTRYVAMRLRLDGSAAVRVHISGMRLTTGQSLLVSNPDGTEVYGPFHGAGPTQSGEFWSEAVSGSDVILELHTGSEGAADLPFTVEAIEASEPIAAAGPSAPQPTAEIVQSFYRGGVIAHHVVDGMAIFEGDVLLGPAHELLRAKPASKDRERSAVGITGAAYRWPNARLPYVIAADLPNQARITGAIAHWNTVMAGVVQLVPRTSEIAYVTFVRPASASSCSSYIGKTFNGSNPINIGDYCSMGNIIHEIGHAWGLWHEHTREDRNSYVVVNLANVQDGYSHNFTQNISNGTDLGIYDFGSIMHYNSTAFSKNGLPTIVTIPAGIPIGQRNALSTGDIAGIRALYPPAVTTPPATVSVTITANPSGASITADSVAYATPATFTWNVGSVHTIAGVNMSTSGMRTTFVSWSDGGAQSHSITASTTVTTYKVDYAVAYSVKAVATPGGSATVSPASADAFYANGTTVGLQATSGAGYCFTGWTGLIAGAPAKTSLVASRAYDLQANFQPGSITLTTPSLAAPSAGGTYSTGITANSGCLWSAALTASWIRIVSATSGVGSATLSFIVDPNGTGASRSASITVEGQLYSITQEASAPQPPATSATASFLFADTTSGGLWKGVYGTEGYGIVNDSMNYPSYAAVTIPATTGLFTWAATTSETRALQKGAAGATGSIASCWYQWSVVNLALSFNDQNPHRVGVYFLDWNRSGRSAKVEVLDANTNSVLDTRSISNFGDGQYLVWTLSGRVTIRVSSTNPTTNITVSGVFFGAPATAPPPPQIAVPTVTGTASFVAADTATRGLWKGVYGTEGFSIVNDSASYPSYAALAVPAPTGLFTWAASTSDTRALKKASATAIDSIASCWYEWSVVNLALSLNDENLHRVAVYFLDWDRGGRSAKVEVLDANTNTVLDTRSISNFGDGLYLVWNLKGRVTIRVTSTNPNTNITVSGVFFGAGASSAPAAPSPAPVVTTASTASFVTADTSTRGLWKGVYGADGFGIVNDSASYPSYATLAVPATASPFTWAATTSDTRALRKGAAGATGSIASCWYQWSVVNLALSFNDQNTHQVAVYFLDWDRLNRSARVDVLDATTNAVLDTRAISNFGDGLYLVWNLKGGVNIRVTSTNPNTNITVSGIFFR